MLRQDLIPVDDFVEVLSGNWEQTLLPSLETAENITDFFEHFGPWQASTYELETPISALHIHVNTNAPRCCVDARLASSCVCWDSGGGGVSLFSI